MAKSPALTPEDPQAVALIIEGHALRAEIAERQERLKAIEGQLWETLVEPGTYSTPAGSIALVSPGPKLTTTDEAIETARKLCPKTIFGKLFERSVSYSPVKAFRDLAAALLTPAKSRDLIAAFEQDSSKYCKWTAVK